MNVVRIRNQFSIKPMLEWSSRDKGYIPMALYDFVPQKSGFDQISTWTFAGFGAELSSAMLDP